jgi:HlyD family secretion protein
VTTSFGAEDSLAIPRTVVRGGAQRRRRLALLAVLLIALAAVVVAALLQNGGPEARYRLAPIAKRTIASEVEATGTVSVEQRVDVPAPSAAQLVRVLVREGASVKAGDRLAELDTSAATIRIESSRAAVDAAGGAVAEARAALAAAQDTLGRIERLHARGLAADAELSSARANADKARAAVAATQAKQAVAGKDLSAARLVRNMLELRAPIAGVVLRAPDATGSIVSPEQGPLFVIGSPLEVVRIDARVAEADVGQVHPEQRVTFSVPAYPGRSFEARIQELGLEGQREAGAVLYPLSLVADNPDGLLRPGMSARLSIQVAVAENVLAVRDAALRFSPDASEPPPEPRIWISSDGVKAKAVEVVVGVSDGAYTEVRPRTPGSLQAGDYVVIGKVTAQTDEKGGPGISLKSKP